MSSGKRDRTCDRPDEAGVALAHDLTEGLATVALFASLVEGRVGPHLDREARRELDRMRAAVEHMLELVAATLPQGRFTAVAPVLVDTRLAAREALSLVEGRVRRSGASVVVGRLPIVAGDPFELMRLFLNLFANSLEYGHPTRMPRVDVRVTRRGRRWRFAVTDNGAGIPAAEIASAFAPEGPGPEAGRGLRICRGIVEAHGGTIEAGARPGGGTIVTFQLPVADDAAPRP